MHKILIADDDSLFLHALAEAVGEAGFEVFAAPNGRKAIELFWDVEVDCVLLDFRMPDMTGMDVMVEIKELQPSIPVIIMSGEADIPVAVSAIKCGAYDFLVKPPDFDELVKVLRTAIALSESDDSTETVSEPAAAYDAGAHGGLSEREMEILLLTTTGHNSSAIGILLNISRRTVETYRERIMKKLRLKSKTELVRYAINNDIVRKVKWERLLISRGNNELGPC